MNNLRLSSELARVVNLFAERKVRALAFKGPVLATTAYRSLGLRWCGDIDLLVSDDDYLAAEEILRNDGYALPQKARALPPAQRRFHLYITRQYPFAKAGRLFIDLHTGIMPAGYMFPLSLDRLWERSHLIEVAGQKVRDCEPEDVLLILCYQGVKNQWERLKHVCDVAELLRSYPELDWDVILERAQSMRGERILLLGLHLAHSISGAPLPNRVLEIIEADTTVAELAEHVFQLLVTERKTGVDLSWRFRLHMKVHNHWSTRLRYGAYTIARRLEERIERATLANPLLKHAA